MGWADRMKNIIDQGLQASADIAGKAGAVVGSKAAELGSKAAEIGSKAAALGEQTAAKAHDASEKSALNLEIKALEHQIGKHISTLGMEAYKCFIEEKKKTINQNVPGIEAALNAIIELKTKIEAKEAAIKEIGSR